MAKYAALIEIGSGWLGKEQYLIKGSIRQEDRPEI